MPLLGRHLLPAVSDSQAWEVSVGIGGPQVAGGESYYIYIVVAPLEQCIL